MSTGVTLITCAFLTVRPSIFSEAKTTSSSARLEWIDNRKSDRHRTPASRRRRFFGGRMVMVGWGVVGEGRGTDLGEHLVDLGALRRMVVLQGQRVIGILADELGGDGGLAAQLVSGHGRRAQVEPPQQGEEGGDRRELVVDSTARCPFSTRYPPGVG